MAQIEIDGKKIEAETGSMIIEAADSAGIWIPRFCYHKKLSIAANCRMCLVEVEKAPKPLPACATPISDGMKVRTSSSKAILSQKSVMEFLLINHPLDCPICDQGGECELQDLSLGYGSDISRFTEGKRVVIDKDIGPLIQTDMTRCIQCTRCVRFGSEIAGLREMGATGRGEAMEIGTFIERSVDSEVSGNIIDLCPVGALTSKPFRYEARGWELTQTPSIAPHDCVGSHIYIHSRRQKVLRVVPKENETLNEIWISDRDRFSYKGLYEERLTEPKIKKQAGWVTVSWKEALETVLQQIEESVFDEGGEQLGVLVSANSTVEECYLLQKWIRSLGSHNIDHRLRQTDFRNDTGVYFKEKPSSLFSLATLPLQPQELEHEKIVILLGSDIRNEQPILNLKLRKLTLNHGKVFVINPMDFPFTFEISGKIIVDSGNLLRGLSGLIKAILNQFENEGENKNKSKSEMHQELLSHLKECEPSEADRVMASHLLKVLKENKEKENNNEKNREIDKEKSREKDKENEGQSSKPSALILLGSYALNHPDASLLEMLSRALAQLLGGRFGPLTSGSNTAGARIAGCLPQCLPGGREIQTPGLNASLSLKAKLKAYVLFGVEPDLECADAKMAVEAFSEAKSVIAFTAFESPFLLKAASILLPICPFTENSGTLVNVFGQWQSFKAAVLPLGESKPGWKILRMLGVLSGLPDFEYQTEKAVLDEIENIIAGEASESKGSPEMRDKKEAFETGFRGTKKDQNADLNLESTWSQAFYNGLKNALSKNTQSMPKGDALIKISVVSLYAEDALVRRSSPLQETRVGRDRYARLHPSVGAKLNLKSGEKVIVEYQDDGNIFELLLDENVPKGSLALPGGVCDTQNLGAPYAELKIKALK